MKYLVIVSCIFLFIPLLTAQESGKEHSFTYVAHRGASYLASENTLASIQLAWESNRPEYTHETIPLLKDVLATIPEDRMLVIEIKSGTGRLVLDS